NQGKPEEALPLLERTVERCERSDTVHHAPRLLLAETLLSLGRLDAAELHFRNVLDTDPQNVRAHFGLGQIAYSRGDWQASRTHLESCLGSPQARQKAAAQLATVCERLRARKDAEGFSMLAARLPKD